MSLIVFMSKLFGSILGFISTVYFARVLGAEVYGIYAVFIAVLAWLKVGGRVGINAGIIKRISEGREQGQYLTAGVFLITMLIISIILLIFIFKSYFEAYISGFEEYSPVSVIWFLAPILALYIVYIPIKSTLHGEGRVHIAGVLNPVEVISKSLFQITLVFLGYSLAGLLIGYAAGIIVVPVIGILFVTVRPQLPEAHHFRSIYNYAKYAWFGDLKSQAFNDVDILILGAFVSQSLVGVYAVVWSLSRFIDIFSVAVSQTVFPEISNISTRDSKEEAAGLIEDSFAYTGIVAIPGFIGGFVLDERLMRIYGGNFIQGTEVLWILLLSILLYGYLKQCLNALNALDRPDLAFRSNLVFITSNVIFNIVLISQIGWVGAAIASAISSGIGLIISYVLLTQTVEFRFPLNEIIKQGVAALIMAGITATLQLAVETVGLIQNNFLIVITLVITSASFYFSFLFAISSGFRRTVRRNIPFGPLSF